MGISRNTSRLSSPTQSPITSSRQSPLTARPDSPDSDVSMSFAFSPSSTSSVKAETQLSFDTLEFLSLPLPTEIEYAPRPLSPLSGYSTFFDDVAALLPASSSHSLTPIKNTHKTCTTPKSNVALKPTSKKQTISTQRKKRTFLNNQLEHFEPNNLININKNISRKFIKFKKNGKDAVTELQKEFTFKALQNLRDIMNSKNNYNLLEENIFRKKTIQQAIDTYPNNPEKSSKPAAKKRKTVASVVSLEEHLVNYNSVFTDIGKLTSRISTVFLRYKNKKLSQCQIITALQEKLSVLALKNMRAVMNDKHQNHFISPDESLRKKCIQQAIDTYPNNPEKSSKPAAKKRKTES